MLRATSITSEPVDAPVPHHPPAPSRHRLEDHVTLLIAECAEQVALFTGISLLAMRSPSHLPEVCDARGRAMWLARCRHCVSPHALAAFFGQDLHATERQIELVDSLVNFGTTRR